MATTSTKKKSKPAKAPAEDSSAFGPIAERFRRAGDLERAVSLCREGLQKFPDHVSARVTLGWALLELTRYDEARTELELVLRRRPDNLAAIRALAELHDRSEHTLNLPMDGPGQWPPSDAAVDAASAEEPVAAVEEPGAVADAVPEPEPELIVSGHNHAIKAAASEPAVMPPAEIGLAMWSAAPEPDAQAAAAVESPAQEPLSAEVFAAPFQAEAVAASETDIAALLAEAESLEAAAEAVKDDITDAATVLLEDDMDLGSFAVETAAIAEPEPSHVEAAAAQAEAEAAAAAAAAAAAEQAEIEAAVRAEAEAAAVAAQAQAQAELEAEAAAAAAAAAQAEIEAAARAQAEADAATARAEAEAAAAAAKAEIEAAAAAVATAQAQAELEAAAAAEAAALAEAEANAFKLVAPTLEDFPEPLADLEERFAATSVDRNLQPELIWELKEAPAVRVVSIVRSVEPTRLSPVPALERLLTKVQARRRQIVAESVA